MPTPLPDRRSSAGRVAVLAMVALAAALASFAVWFQWNQTKRCLALYGPATARSIQYAKRVELWSLAADAGRPRGVTAIDVSKAPGLVHLRRGLVEDANFAWDAASAGRLPAEAWDAALAFYGEGAREPAAVVAFDLDGAGWLTVVGQPGRIGLGRMARGLRTWCASTTAELGR